MYLNNQLKNNILTTFELIIFVWILGFLYLYRISKDYYKLLIQIFQTYNLLDYNFRSSKI